MCLHKIMGKPEKTSGIGYKVYVNCNSGVRTATRGLDGTRNWMYGEELNLNQKYTSVKSVVEDDKGKTYKSGFHIFENIKDAKDWKNSGIYDGDVVVKVQYKKARLRGTQKIEGGRKERPCIIADEITLLEIV